MGKIIFLLFGMFLCYNSLNAQDKVDFKEARTVIQDLLKQQEDSLQKFEKKKIVKLFGLKISNDEKTDSYKFSFGRGSVLRFYLYTTKGQVKLSLMQSNWSDASKKRLILFETKTKSVKNDLKYYDYNVVETNDFELLLTAVGNEEAMAKVLAVQIILEGDHYFYPEENKVVIINENDTIIQYY